MDVQLAGESGLACTNRIREIDKKKGRHTPIIAVTAHAMMGDKERCLESGMDDYLSKPFTMGELKEKLARWVQSKEEPVDNEAPATNTGNFADRTDQATR